MYADLVIQICNIQLNISQTIPTIPPIRPSPLVCGGKMAISWGYFCLFHYTTLSEIPFFVLNRVRVLKTSAAHRPYETSSAAAALQNDFKKRYKRAAKGLAAAVAKNGCFALQWKAL